MYLFKRLSYLALTLFDLGYGVMLCLYAPIEGPGWMLVNYILGGALVIAGAYMLYKYRSVDFDD